MGYFAQTKPSKIFWVFSILGLIIAVGLTITTDYDLWWHLKTGEVIWTWKQIPIFDLFSYSAPGMPWTNHEWLFQIITWLLYSTFGLASISMLKLAGTAAIAYIAFGTFRVFVDSKSTALWGCLIMVWGIADRVLERPHLFSMFFIAYYCLCLHRFCAGKRKHLWEIPLLELVWANLHGGGIFGPMMLAVFTLGEWGHRFFDRPWKMDNKDLYHLSIITILTFGASLINPTGIDIYLFSASHLQMKTILAHTQEWLPLSDYRIDKIISIFLARSLIVATLLSYLINLKNVRLSHLALTVISSMLILNGKRFAPDFIIINLPILFFNLKAVTAKIRLSPNAGHLHAWGNILLVFLISNLVLRDGLPMTIKGDRIAIMGMGTIAEYTPEDMVSFLDRNNIHGNIFNEMSIGGYLIFKRWPSELVFLDGRTPVYGDDFYRNFIGAFLQAKNFEQLEEQYNFDYIVFRAGSAREIYEFHKYLWESKRWKLVYARSDEGLVYLKNVPKFKELIAKFAFKRHPLIDAVERKKSHPAL